MQLGKRSFTEKMKQVPKERSTEHRQTDKVKPEAAAEARAMSSESPVKMYRLLQSNHAANCEPSE